MRMSDLIDREALLRQIDIDSEGEPGYYGDTWKFIDTIKSMPPAELSTNLAEVGTDCISRQAAIDAIRDMQAFEDDNGQPYLYLYDVMAVFTDEEELPTIHPEPHWIPVDLENNEPQLEEWVLVSSDGYVMQDCIVERGGEKIWYHGGNIQADDRYMPLPEPFKGDAE